MSSNISVAFSPHSSSPSASALSPAHRPSPPFLLDQYTADSFLQLVKAVHSAKASLNLRRSNSTLALRTKLPNGEVCDSMITSPDGGGIPRSASFLSASV